MLSALLRESVLTLSTDLNKLADEIRLAAPHYFLNVPTFLERVKRGVEDNIAKQAGPIRALYVRASEAWQRQHVGRGKPFDALWLALGRKLIFAKVKSRFGPNLRALRSARLRSPRSGNATIFPDARHPRALQAYGLNRNQRALHTRRSTSSRRARLRRPRNFRNRNAARRQRRNHRSRPEYFFRLLESIPKKPQKFCVMAGSTPAIKAKSTSAATGASSVA